MLFPIGLTFFGGIFCGFAFVAIDLLDQSQSMLGSFFIIALCFEELTPHMCPVFQPPNRSDLITDQKL